MKSTMRSNASANKKTFMKSKVGKVGILDEDSKPSTNPDVYLDTLPEPFNFINE